MGPASNGCVTISPTREEIHIKRPRRQRANASYGVRNLLGRKICRAQRSEPARVRNRGD